MSISSAIGVAAAALACGAAFGSFTYGESTHRCEAFASGIWAREAHNIQSMMWHASEFHYHEHSRQWWYNELRQEWEEIWSYADLDSKVVLDESWMQAIAAVSGSSYVMPGYADSFFDVWLEIDVPTPFFVFAREAGFVTIEGPTGFSGSGDLAQAGVLDPGQYHIRAQVRGAGGAYRWYHVFVGVPAPGTLMLAGGGLLAWKRRR